jgi:hypothetical protein
MIYYVLAQKKERGCPLGMLNGFLYDKAAPPNTPHYGLKPWYANADAEYPVFEKEMFFNSKDKLYNFDIRGEHGHFIVSEQFKATLDDFKVPIVESVPLKIVNSAFNNIGEKSYHLVRLASSIYHEHDDIFEEDMELLWDGSGRLFSIVRARIKSDIDLPFFKIAKQDQDAIFCSAAFYNACNKHGMKGIEFLRFENIVWKLQTNENILDFLSEASPTVFIR